MTRHSAWIKACSFFSLLALAGCASSGTPYRGYPWGQPHASMETLTEDAADHRNRVAAIGALDRKSLAEDLDLLFMTERKSRLNRWHNR